MSDMNQDRFDQGNNQDTGNTLEKDRATRGEIQQDDTDLDEEEEPEL